MKPSQALCLYREDLRALALERGLVEVRVFGSTARGEDREDSDLDLLLTVDAAGTLFPAMGFILEAQRRFPGVAIDAVTNIMARPEILNAAMREGFLL
ncbi:nucleotidyltransferase domain-containing protein [Massilia sp. CCM 9210]|uniref:nucleotidyltransferase family protein n=1 Tax=Massilia scottii TaxID=3057166 RepID=UPI0027963D92|nr:nucleotidyltransferase domain-containing protein [Massilia sp. CCM 9210]MDQ1816218.1 nucleotidyltransferase domain-containing protein [Massilia sp. CCM 9210]